MLIFVVLLIRGEDGTLNLNPQSLINALCVSLKHDVEEHPPLFMNGVLIEESMVLSILGFHFDSCLTWDYMIDSAV